ncbi:pantothenate transporter [Aspergillus niger CBS 101883]|uniref:pantothenate transporter n=1 Tax=Aspergillus lacticoffeatus (strain CBS 101883) TaxID=1450533 RepID=UPI000D802D27|nr:pantothenate transporter [Aspergillus niger CBS 101883]PYH56941.1 pantothenate transporter [Aspergillus niger CBS 101883]
MKVEPKTTDPSTSKDVNIDVGTIRLHFSAEEEKRVVRKIDCFILPLMCLVFFFQDLDKQSLSYASVFGLIDDLSLEGSEYSWCSSLFYLGQLVAEYPFIYLMSRLPLTKFVGATIVFWGAVCMCLAAPTNFAGFGAVRFLLGVTEGAVSPAFVTLTSMWYRKKEHASRVGIWVTMNGLAQVLGSLLMYGIGKQHYPRLEPWRVLFLVCGALTAAFGVVFYFLVPTGPQKAWFLSEREREVLLARMAQDREGGDRTNFSKAQVIETLLDVRAWFIFAFGILVTMQSPVLTFASLIIKNLNYDKYQTMLYTSPSGAVQIVAIWIGVLGCQLLPNNRSLVVILLSIPPLIGNVLLLKLPLTTGWGLIVSSWLASCISDVMVILLSLSASNVKGNTKRAMANTMYFIGYCVGCIAGPQLWQTKSAPRFFEGVVTAIVTWCVLVLAMVLYWYLCRAENIKRDQDTRTSAEIVLHTEDITDIEDRLFRYSY